MGDRKRCYVSDTGVWTRFFPIVSALKDIIHHENRIGDVYRVFIDNSSYMPISSLPADSRLRDLSKGAGALLDIGIYTLTWAAIVLDQHPENGPSKPVAVSSAMTLIHGVDEATSIVLNYPSLKAHAICTTTMLRKFEPIFGRIEGSNGTVLIGGNGASKPMYLVVQETGKVEERLDFPVPPKSGFFHDYAIAKDLSEGRTESSVMPLAESLRIMQLMDSVRYSNVHSYPQDE